MYKHFCKYNIHFLFVKQLQYRQGEIILYYGYNKFFQWHGL